MANMIVVLTETVSSPETVSLRFLMLINGGVVVCKFFLANARQCFEMGGVIQGGMLPQ